MSETDEHLVGNLIDLSPVDGFQTQFPPDVDRPKSQLPEDEPKSEFPPDVDRRKSKTSVKFEENTLCASDDKSESKQFSRLCGYLNKLGNRSILNTFKKRWFVFNEDNCRLYYYRSPQESVPLGEIDIAQATFTINVDNKERTGHFTISVPGRSYFLEANNRQAALYWLQELQKHRRTNSLLRTKHISEKSTNITDLRARPQSGLLANDSLHTNSLDEESEGSLMSPVCCPTDCIGDDSAANKDRPLVVAQQKLNVFYNQIKQSAPFSKHDKSSQDGSITYPKENNHQDNHVSSSSKRESFDGESISSQKSTKSPSLSAFKLKLSSSFRKSRGEGEMDDMNAAEKGNCSLCRNYIHRIEVLEEELSNLHDELTASQEVRSLLQRQLDIASKEKETLVQIYQLKNSELPVDVINEKDCQIVNLNHDLQEQKQANEELQRENDSLKREVKDLLSNNELFQEMMIQKDKTIMNLTNEVFELETDKKDEIRRMSSGSFLMSPESAVVEPKEIMDIDDLKAAVDAFELQNKFLNNEILELNQLRADADERVQLMSIKCSEWEARSYQIQSKLLYLLNELKKSDSGKFNTDAVSQLLEEAVGEGTVHTNLLPSWSRDILYDELGFNYRWGREDILSLKASNFKQKSQDIAHKKDPELISWRAKWDNFIVALGSKELIRSPELKVLVRSGVPHEYKGKIWKGCVNMWIKDYKSMLGPDYYKSLLTSEHFVSRLDPSSKQIELDLLRTLPNNRHYENIDSDGIPKLRRVLLAYSRHNPVVGYCQGLNRLAAIALLFMDEEDAFWCLVAIIKFIMPDGYYTPTLIASHVDQKVLKDLLADKLPRLNVHLEQNNVDLSLFTFNWFLTIYVDNVPPEIYLRIWDVFLYEGSKVLFRYALAFLKSFENEILQIKDYLALNKHLRSIAEESIDIKKLTHIAFNELNPFPQKMLNTKRSHNFQIIRAQLEELENERKKQKKSVMPESVTSSAYMSEED